MATLLPPDKGAPQLLPSPPPSPGPTEEDLTKADGTWNDEPAPSARRKGKERETMDITDPPLTPGADGGEEMPLGSATSDAYPPMNDEEAETRRVEETLRQWESAERQRRKAARGSQNSAPDRPTSSGSYIGDVARRASLLWSSRRTQRPPSNGTGAHTILKERESDDVWLDDIDHGALVNSPTGLSHPPAPSKRGDPFRGPTLLSPFDDPEPQSPGSSSSMSASSTSSIGTVRPGGDNPPRPILEAASSFPDTAAPPAPEPLNLPRPRSPPPRTETPHANRPPEPLPPPDASGGATQRRREAAEAASTAHEPESRWWTDWLCGCSPSRPNDNQAGRTNPFE